MTCMTHAIFLMNCKLFCYISYTHSQHYSRVISHSLMSEAIYELRLHGKKRKKVNETWMPDNHPKLPYLYAANQYYSDITSLQIVQKHANTCKHARTSKKKEDKHERNMNTIYTSLLEILNQQYYRYLTLPKHAANSRPLRSQRAKLNLR